MTLLSRYLSRLGLAGPAAPNLETVTALHRAHVDTIPFEGLDVLLGRVPALGLAEIAAKLLDGGRGGYCYEQNSLFKAVLEAMGLPTTLLMARVRLGAGGVTRPRTHALLRVDVDGRSYVADVGFGGWGLAAPLRLDAGVERHDGLMRHRLMKTGDVWVLQAALPEGWIDLYAFTLEPHYAVDLDAANHYTATHPDSPFHRLLLVQRIQPGRRIMLRGAEMLALSAEGVAVTRLASPSAALDVLRREFALVPPPGLADRLGALIP